MKTGGIIPFRLDEELPEEMLSARIEPPVYIDDTTLRDGEQTAGVVFAKEEKIYIAKLLARLGVHQIEAGIPPWGATKRRRSRPSWTWDFPPASSLGTGQ